MDKVKCLKILEEITNAMGFENCIVVFSRKDAMQAVKIEPTKYPHQDTVFNSIIEILFAATDAKAAKITRFDKNYQQPENN